MDSEQSDREICVEGVDGLAVGNCVKLCLGEQLEPNESIVGALESTARTTDGETNILSPNNTVPKRLSEMSKKYKIDMSMELGSGFASVVYLAHQLETSTPICAKIIDYYSLGGNKERRFLQNEINNLKKFHSSHIVQIYDVYESESFCYLMMECCPGGDLYRFMLRNEELDTRLIGHIVRQICLGLLELKKEGVLHRDLKTENIFLGHDFEVKIGDLGFCVEADGASDMLNVGSPIYMSPEVLAHGPFSYQSDIYGLGIIWYELLHKQAPWEASSEKELLERKINEPLVFMREDIPEGDLQMIRKCLANNVQERCSIEELLTYFDGQLVQLQRTPVQEELSKH